MTRYFLITGLDEGLDITPHIEETDGSQPYSVVNPPYGDHARWAEELTKSEVIEYMKNGIKIWWFKGFSSGDYRIYIIPLVKSLK